MAAAGVIFLWVLFLAGGSRVGARHRLITGAEVSYEAVGESDMEGSVPSDLAELDPIMNFYSARVATNMCMKRGVMDVPMSFNVKGVCARYQCTKSLGRHTDIATVQPERCPIYKKPCVVPDKVKFLQYPKCCPENCARHIGSMARFPFLPLLIGVGKAIFTVTKAVLAAGKAVVAVGKLVVKAGVRKALVKLLKAAGKKVVKEVSNEMAEMYLKEILGESYEIIEKAKKTFGLVKNLKDALSKNPSKELLEALTKAEKEDRLAQLAADKASEAIQNARKAQALLDKQKEDAAKGGGDSINWWEILLDVITLGMG